MGGLIRRTDGAQARRDNPRVHRKLSRSVGFLTALLRRQTAHLSLWVLLALGGSPAVVAAG